MKVSFISVTAMFGIGLFFPFIAFGASVFEGSQKGSLRENVNLFGGYVEDIAMGSDGTVYVALNSPNGIFVSGDSGATWNPPQIGADLGSIIALETSEEPGVAYVIGGIHLFQTQDSGTTWNEIAGSRGDTKASDFSQTMLYVAGTLYVPVRDGTLDVSTDEGETFSSTIIDSSVTSVTAMAGAADGSMVYVLGSGNDTEDRVLYRLTSGVWSALNLSGNYSRLAVSPDDSDIIVVGGSGGTVMSSDGGLSWTALNNEPLNANITIKGSRIYLGNRYTENNGATWQTFASDSNVKAQKIFIDPANPDIIYADSGRGIAKSSDAGVTWSESVEGMLGVTVNDIAQTADKSVVWLAAQGGLAKTENFLDATPTWEFPIQPDQMFESGKTVYVDPENANVVLAGAASLFRSEDSGATWEEVLANTETPGTFMTIVANSDASALYAGFAAQSGGGTVYKSSGGGATWEDLDAPDIAANAIAITEDGMLIVGVGTERDSAEAKRGLYSFDGTTWTQLSGALGHLVNDVLSVNDVLYAASGETQSGGVFRSTDAGATWEELTEGLPTDGWFQAIVADAGDAHNLYVSTARPAGTGSIYKSADSGNSWSLYYKGLVDEKFTAFFFDGLMSGTNTGLYAMQSEVSFALSKKKNSSHVTLTARLLDGATKDSLANKKIQLWKKKGATWKHVTTEKTNTKGIAKFRVVKRKNVTFQVRWKPATTDRETYGTRIRRVTKK